MPTLTINIAGRGTLLSNGDASQVGHMWYSLTDNNGNSESYGFSPVADATGLARANGPGEVNAHGFDDSFYQGPRDFTKTIELTQAQYDAMKLFGENPSAYGFDTFYNGLNNSCIDFTWKAMERGGLNIVNFQGEVWPTMNGVSVSVVVAASQVLFKQNQIWSPAFSLTFCDVSPICNTAFAGAKTVSPAPKDPLILDLDNDGLETLGINTTTPILFDHDADGVKTATS
jgi:hypothetical protein